MKVEIRNETPADYLEVEEMTRDAFWNLYVPGCDEHYLVHIIRDHPDFLPELDFVAELDGRIVGNIQYTKSWVTDETGRVVDTLSFGPLCVRPGYQRKGIGGALIAHTRRLAEARGCPAILIYGDPHNYCKHGFKNGRDFNVSDMGGRYPLGLLVLELHNGFFAGHQWKLQQSKVFEFDMQAAEDYDRQLPPKVKAEHYSQVLFAMQIRAHLD